MMHLAAFKTPHHVLNEVQCYGNQWFGLRRRNRVISRGTFGRNERLVDHFEPLITVDIPNEQLSKYKVNTVLKLNS